MRVSVSGSGITLVFIHGYCEDGSIWHHFEKSLSKNYEVVLIDLPGHGQSELSSNDFSVDDIADEVHDELVARDINHYFLIGHSLGGYVSLALADLYPKNVIGFGLLSSTTFADDEEKKKARDKVRDFISEHGVDKFIEPFVPNLIAQSNRKLLTKEIASLIAIGKNTSGEAIVAYAQAMKNRPDRTKLLASSLKPVFIIAGDRDMAVRKEASEQMIEMIQYGEGLLLEEVGHNGFIEAPIQCLDFIEGFLDSHLD